MALEYYVDDYLIPEGDVLMDPIFIEKIVDSTNDLIASSLDVVLSNTDKTKYDDRWEGSLFYGDDHLNSVVKIWDTVRAIYIWKGLVKNISTTEEKIIIATTNYIQNLTDKKCVYANSSNKTPAQIIYEILVNVVEIPTGDIAYRGFQDAINYQDSGSLYTNCNFTVSDNQTCISVINELCRISSCYLYVQDNIICLHQWKEWAGQVGIRLRNQYVLSRSYSQVFSWENEVLNYFTIAYDNSGTIAYATGSDGTSITQYGRKDFVVPDKSVGSSSSAHKILIRNATGANFAGNLILSRWAYRKKYFNITLDSAMEFMKLSYIIALNFDTFKNEPATIIEKSLNKYKREIAIKGEFLNIPHEYYSRDLEAPAKPELISAYTEYDGTVTLKWTKNWEADFLGNKIYFTTSKGEWWTEQCHAGKSPIDVKGSDLTYDGYRYFIIGKLNLDVEYYFKITSYDQDFNESDYSNIKSCVPERGTGIYYCLTGDPFDQGLELDINNSMGGVLPDDEMLVFYDEENYDQGTYSYTAVYESPELNHPDGFTSIKIRGFGDPGDILFAYQDLDTGGWSTPEDVVGVKIISLGGAINMKYRILFTSTSWSDADRAYVLDVI